MSLVFYHIECLSATPGKEKDISVKIIIESVIDKERGEAIDNATLIIHVKREGKEGIVFEDYDFSEYVIEGNIGDIVSIEVTAPDYAKWHLLMRFKKVGFMKFPVKL